VAGVVQTFPSRVIAFRDSKQAVRYVGGERARIDKADRGCPPLRGGPATHGRHDNRARETLRGDRRSVPVADVVAYEVQLAQRAVRPANCGQALGKDLLSSVVLQLLALLSGDCRADRGGLLSVARWNLPGRSSGPPSAAA
jgi:hypothetical protein